MRTDLDKRSIVQKAMAKQKFKVVRKDLSSVRSLMRDDNNVALAEKYKTKSELLTEADALFSTFIRNRDADKNGNVACVCCKKVYNINDVDGAGKKNIQVLHFIDRSVYSLRFDEDNGHAGCSFCNLDMFLNKNGVAYRRYLEFMNTEYGEEAVAEMTLAHRQINKLEVQQLKNIIEHYSK